MDASRYYNAEIDTEITWEQKLAFLKDPANYPEAANHVDVVDTHLSCVFLTGAYVYKLKKPFLHNYLRLKTPESRHHNCLREVALNRRLANDVYLGVVALSADQQGNLAFGSGHRVVDWLVKMRRLPEYMMLGKWIVSDRVVPPEALEKTAALLTHSYLASPPVTMTGRAYLQKLEKSLTKYHEALLDPRFCLPRPVVDIIYERQTAFILRHRPMLEKRAHEGHVKEAHGDLKPDHICLSPTAIIDCLEFDRDLRTMDVADDLAFLALECDRLGTPWIGEYFIRYYGEKARDSIPEELLHFYKSRKAYSRALLSIRHVLEPRYQQNPKWRNRCEEYLAMAASYLQKEH